jgi:hypothetical protein
MKVLEQGGLASLALLALAGRAVASVDETVTATLLAGSTGSQIAVTVGSAWSQAGAFTCGVAANQLTVVNTSGDCTPPTTIYTFRVDGGTLTQNHTFKLRIQCASPPVASVEFDGGGFNVLVPGVNTFVAGADTIRIGYLQPPFPCPALSPGELVVLALLLSSAGYRLARSARLPALAG